MQDKTIVSERHCYFEIPKTQLLPNGRDLIQITYRPKVEDDDFCSEFSLKFNSELADDIFGQPAGKAESTSSNLIVDSGGRSRDISDGIQGRLP
jgi:hypothetical protein